MADTGITSGRLIQDWYERYVRPLKQPISLTSSAPQDFSLGLPASATPTPTATIAPPADTPTPSPAPMPGTMTPAPETSAPSAEGESWTDKLNRGLQDPAKVGLLGAGLSMMATPPRAVKYSAGEIVGNAGLTGLKYFQQAVEDKRKADLMVQTAEEHKLTREDRRMAAEDRGQYYRDVVEIRRLTAESQAEARKATAAENAVLDVPIDPAVAKHYGVDPKMTVRTFNKMQSGLVSMAKPEKPAKADPFTTWHEKYTKEHEGKEPGTKEIAEWHRSASGEGGTDSGPGKTAAIALINKEMVLHYLPAARDEISKSAPPGSERMRQMVESLNTQDPTTGGPNEAKMREHLSETKRKEYDAVKEKAQEYSKTMTPASAFAKAKREWDTAHPAPKTDTRYEEYRRVYEEIRYYPGWTNAEKNAKIKEMNDKARKMGLIK